MGDPALHRFWIRVHKETRGPFTAEQLVRLPGVDEESLVCREHAKDAEAWAHLKDFPELLQALKPTDDPAKRPAHRPARPPERYRPEEPSSNSALAWLLIAAIFVGGLVAAFMLGRKVGSPSYGAPEPAAPGSPIRR